MDGVNNQLMNPMIAQNLGVFQELAGSPNEFEDLFPSLQDGQEDLDFPLHPDEVEVTHSQETQDVNAAESFNNEFIQKQKSKKWTKEEDKRFIELKHQQPYLPWKDFAQYFPGKTRDQCYAHWFYISEPSSGKKWTKELDEQFIKLKHQQPDLPWKDFAQYFPGYTSEQCKAHWNKVLEPRRLRQENKLIDLDVKHIDPEAATPTPNWTKEENQRFIELKHQQPKLSWEDFAKHFPGHTVKQCSDHWRNLKIKLIRKRKLTTEDDFYNHLSKRSRTEPSGPAISAASAENTSFFVAPSQDVSQELAVLPVSSPSNPLQEVQKILDFPLHHYEGAVNHLQEIQLGDPLLQSFQQEAAQVLANTKKTYQDMKERLTETAGSLLIQEAKSLANLCQTSTYYFETVYQHYLSYQTSQESKEWFTSQSEEFANLYMALLKGKIDQRNFHHLTSLKERDHCYQNLNNLFIQYRNVLKKHSSRFSFEYNTVMDESFFNIRLQFNFLKDAQQDWKSMASGLKEVLSRLQEIGVFLDSFFNHVPSAEIESTMIARLKNEISLQDFYTKQGALMAAQKRREQTGDSIPSQQSSQIQKDLPSSHISSPLLNQDC